MRGYQERCGLEDTDFIARKYSREILLTLMLHKLQKNSRCSQSFLTMNSFYELCFREFKIDFNNDSLSPSVSLSFSLTCSCICMFMFPMTKSLLSGMSNELKNNSTMLH